MKKKILTVLLVILGVNIYSASAAESPSVLVPMDWFNKTVVAKDEWNRKYVKSINQGLTKVCDGTNLIYVFYSSTRDFAVGVRTSSIAVVPGGCRK